MGAIIGKYWQNEISFGKHRDGIPGCDVENDMGLRGIISIRFGNFSSCHRFGYPTNAFVTNELWLLQRKY